MARIIKPLGETTDEQFLTSLLGKLIHVPTNKHIVPNHLEGGKEEEINGWFAGQVAGYEKAVIAYDYENDEFIQGGPHTLFNVLLTGGQGYLLHLTNSEIVELTDQEFDELVAEHQAITLLTESKKELLVPERKIILPDEVK